MVSLLRQVSRGIDAGKFFEIMYEMRLIEIATIRSHIRPGKIRAVANLPQDLLKAADAGEEFGRESNFAGEKLDETARADAYMISKFSDGGSGMNVAEKTQRAIDCSMPLQRLERLL